MRIFRNYSSVLKGLSVALLLGIYLSAVLFNSLHEYVHQEHHSHEICTKETEKDPCHKRVFHHDLAEGCKHKTHMLSLESSCKLCDAIVSKYYFSFQKIVSQFESKSVQNPVIFEQSIIFRISTTAIQLRAPPGHTSFLS